MGEANPPSPLRDRGIERAEYQAALARFACSTSRTKRVHTAAIRFGNYSVNMLIPNLPA